MTVAVATAALIPDLNSVDVTEKTIILRGTVTVGASPLTYATGGITLDLTAFGDFLKSGSLPTEVKIWSNAPASAPNTAQYLYSFAKGTTQKNGTMQVWTGAAAQSGLAELSAGSVPAGVSGDVISIRAEFPRV
jgi:hypothetical protein